MNTTNDIIHLLQHEQRALAMDCPDIAVDAVPVDEIFQSLGPLVLAEGALRQQVRKLGGAGRNTSACNRLLADYQSIEQKVSARLGLLSCKLYYQIEQTLAIESQFGL